MIRWPCSVETFSYRSNVNVRYFAMFRALIVATLLSVGLTACQQPEATALDAAPPAPVDQVSFDSCVDQQAKAVVAHAVATGTDPVMVGYHTDLNNDVIAQCAPQLTPETLSDSEYSPDPNYQYVNNTVEEQVDAASNAKAQQEAAAEQRQEALDAPRIKTEDEEDHQAVVAYYACLVSSVKILSKESDELAQVIVQAAYPSCSAERNAAFTIMQTHRPYLDSGVMVDIDNKLEPVLLLDVIRDRAPPATPQP